MDFFGSEIMVNFEFFRLINVKLCEGLRRKRWNLISGLLSFEVM